jgi:bile acid:Na+ symporter, BASS family
MFRTKDLVLLLVVFSSMGTGLIWPQEAGRLAPFLNWFLMLMLYLAFLKIFPQAIWSTVRQYPYYLIILLLIKLIILPLIIFSVAVKIFPVYALGLLMLAAVSTGVSAPFFTGVVGGNIPLVLVMTVVTSMLLPLSMPLLVKLLAGRDLSIDLIHLGSLIGAIIFLPLAGAGITRRLGPRLTDWLEERSYYLSLFLIGFINLGSFGNFAPFLQAHQDQLVVALLLSSGLAVVLAATGALVFWFRPPPQRTAAAASLGWINNVLVIVLGNDLNDPFTSILAALYLIPFHLLIVPLSHLSRISSRRSFKEVE